MRRMAWAMGALAAAMALAYGAPASAQATEQAIQRELEAWYGRVVAAYRAKDPQSYTALLAPDARVTTSDGKTVNRQTVEEWAKQDMAHIPVIYSARAYIRRLTLGTAGTRTGAANSEPEATAYFTERWRYKMLDPNGRYGSKGKSYIVEWTQRDHSTFVKTDAGWLLKRGAYESAPSLTVNGKPLRPRSTARP